MSTIGKRRALGQHFLRDTSVCTTIIDQTLELAQETHCKALLEIGPGRGALTLPLLAILKQLSENPGETELFKHFLICERDRDLITLWENSDDRKNAGIPSEVLGGDFMEVPEESWLKETPLAVMSNLPYSAGTAILTRLARHSKSIPVMVLMFQKEVAARLRAEPDTSAWGSLSIWIQNRWDVKKLLSVPPRAFQPPPDVDSEVVVLTARATPRIPSTQDPAREALFESLIKACFAHRRKMLRSGLSAHPEFKNALEPAGIAGTLRAEALGWSDWERFLGVLK